MSGLEIAAIALVVTVAACLQGSIGFGLGLLAAPVIALIDPTLLPATVILLATCVTVLGVLRDRIAVDFRDASWALLGRVPGTIAGALLVAALPARGLALVLAGTVLLGVILSVRGWRPLPGPAAVSAAGAASGLLGTATSIGGPPMALVWQQGSTDRMRGTMSAFFLVGACLSLGALALVGAIDSRTLTIAALLAPAVLLGFALSTVANRRLNHRRIRQTALIASALGALLVIAQTL